MPVCCFGFPRMHKEKMELRDFVPFLFGEFRKDKDLGFFLEESYGEGMGYTREDYLRENPNIVFCSHDECYRQECVVVLRAPSSNEFLSMKRGSILFSMLHYETNEQRNELFRSLGINCLSMDGLVDDDNHRMLVNYIGTAGSGVKVAYGELKNRWEGFFSTQRPPIQVTIIGLGELAQKAAKWFEILSDADFVTNSEFQHCKGLFVKLLPRSITRDVKTLNSILKETDILVDASKRPDPSRFIVSNDSVGMLPEHAVILDLSADPYDFDRAPRQVKGIEGIPTGNLDEYVIERDSDLYQPIQGQIKSRNRRLVLSCNAWPGLEPKSCMELYSKQILPFISILSKKSISELGLDNRDFFERALFRSSLVHYFNSKNHEIFS